MTTITGFSEVYLTALMGYRVSGCETGEARRSGKIFSPEPVTLPGHIEFCTREGVWLSRRQNRRNNCLF